MSRPGQVRMLGALVAGALCLPLSCPVRADPPARAAHDDGPGCDLAGVKRHVAVLLGRDPFVPGTALVVLVAIERRGDSLEAHLDFTGAAGPDQGTRTLSAPTCEELESSLAVVIGLVLRSHTRQGRVHRARSMAATPAPGAHPRADRATAASRSVPLEPGPAAVSLAQPALEIRRQTGHPPAAASDGVALLLGGGAGSSTTGWLAELHAGARLRRGRRSIALEVHLSPPEAISAVDSDGHIEVRTTSISLAPCAHLGPAALCGTLAAGWIRGSGRSLFEARSAVEPLAAVGGEIAWEHALTGAIAARGFLDLRARLTCATFEIDHMAVWSSPRLEGWLGLGLAATIP